jgi:eukaryotic-like serine/threonine-protein kinase
MPAHPATVAEFCTVLTKSRLIPEAEVQVLQHRWKTEMRGSESDVDAFRKNLVSKRLLTDYQSALLQRGHSDGFFVGGYIILDRLGKGATAGVYKAVHTSGQVVAIKVLAGSKAKQPSILNRFQREGRLLCQLDHPNVVRAFQLGQSGSVHFIVMEHLDGETLDEIINRRKQIPYTEACRLVSQALKGLQHLNEKNMVHRDLKPANLMVLPNEEDRVKGGDLKSDSTLLSTVKILDIGIGRELFDDDSPVTHDLAITGEGDILGTPDYIAPEQARDARNADVRADIYSLGCVLFHLIAGRPPFLDRSTLALMVKHAMEPIPRLSEFVSGVPVALQNVLEKMTAKKAEDRYQTPIEAANALTPFLPVNASTVSAPPVLPAYQKWLETESGMEMEAPPEIMKKSFNSTPAPAAASSSAKSGASERTTPSKTTTPAPTRPTARTNRPADDMPTIDVELVTLPLPTAPASVPVAEPPRSLLDWDRRDFMILGFGSGGMLLAMGLGYTLSKLLKTTTQEPMPQVEPETKSEK